MSDTVSKGRSAAATGFANENRLLAALLSRGHNASKVDLPHSSYDILLELGINDFVRIQVKTVSPSGSISFTGGTRGGVDREYKSEVKTYTQNTKTSDIVVGVRVRATNGDSAIDFYFVPTKYIEHIGQKSISIKKISQFKNNWAILRVCKMFDPSKIILS